MRTLFKRTELCEVHHLINVEDRMIIEYENKKGFIQNLKFFDGMETCKAHHFPNSHVLKINILIYKMDF